MFIFKSKSGKGYKIYDTDTHTYECVSQSVLDKALSLGITIVGLDREMAIQKAKVFNDMHIDTTGSMTAIRGRLINKRILLSEYVDTLNIDPTLDISGVTFVLDDTLKLGYSKVSKGMILRLFAEYNVKLDISLLSDSGCRDFYRHITSTSINDMHIGLVPEIVVDTVEYRNVYANTVVAYILSNTKIDLSSEHTAIRMIWTHLKGEEGKVYSLIKQWLTDSDFYTLVYKQETLTSGYGNLNLLSKSSYYSLNSNSIDRFVYYYYVDVCKKERFLYPFLLFCTLGLETETEATALTYMQDYARCLLRCIENL